MSTSAIGKPAPTEYGAHFGRYINLIEDPDVIRVLESQLVTTRVLLESISEETSLMRYEPGKWSIRELVGHIADCERVFAYRALRFARNDKTELPGFDQDTFAANAGFHSLPMQEIRQEYESVRQSTLFLFKHLQPEAWTRRGVANQNESTVRALAFTIAGHELHHTGILKSRYLSREL
jgi:hypothetical protein